MAKFKIHSPSGATHFVHMETREKAIEHVARIENADNVQDYHNFDSLVQKLDLSPNPQNLFETEPEPKPASGILLALENRKISTSRKYHTEESLKMSMEIAVLIDKYKRYGYSQYDMEDLSKLLDQYDRIRPK